MKDQCITVEGNLRSDYRNKSRENRVRNATAMKFAKAFFTEYPSKVIKQMDLSDFKRKNPDFTVQSLVVMKGLRTRLKKQGIL